MLNTYLINNYIYIYMGLQCIAIKNQDIKIKLVN